MNEVAFKKHEIYNKLADFSKQELCDVANYIDSIRHKKQKGEKKVIKLEGILKGHNIDFADLKRLKEDTWKHVDEEFDGE